MLEIKNLSFAVEEDGRQKEILRNLNLTIDDGKFVVITGPNGSGKSTLARLIMGIEKPTEGSILFDGRDVTGLDITERARLGISFAFQQPVRFKGIRVKDLLRLASGKNLSVSERGRISPSPRPANTSPRSGCVRETTSTGKSTPPSRAEN